MKIAAIVVTYNRLELLKLSIDALKNQEEQADEIIVINNNSTDGTTEWLTQQTGITVVWQENTGGAGGFYTGLKQAYEKGFDWFWVMDDDTIPYPGALSAFKKNINDFSLTTHDKIGFIASKVIWKDGQPHLMNLPHLSTFDQQQRPFNAFDQFDLFAVNSSSFVSLLISREALTEVGLPVKEFYIWGDDTEFTNRMVKQGFQGFYSPKSVVLHDTGLNYSANLFTDTPNNIWKYSYGIRNELFVIRHFNGFGKYFSKFLKRLFVFPFRILKKRKDHRWVFIKVNWSATLASLGFNPTINKV